MLLSSTGILIRNFLPELDMQASAEVILKYFLASTGMFQRTAVLCFAVQCCAVLCCAALSVLCCAVCAMLCFPLGPVEVKYPGQIKSTIQAKLGWINDVYWAQFKSKIHWIIDLTCSQIGLAN